MYVLLDVYSALARASLIAESLAKSEVELAVWFGSKQLEHLPEFRSKLDIVRAGFGVLLYATWLGDLLLLWDNLNSGMRCWGVYSGGTVQFVLFFHWLYTVSYCVFMCF